MSDPKGFVCICRQEFVDAELAVRHVELLHAGEFDAENLAATEEAVERLITPSPLEALGYWKMWERGQEYVISLV